MRTLAIAAQKGGVGKTTTVVHLALALCRKGERVLVIDMDPQAAATSLLAPGKPPARGTTDVMLEGASLADAMVHTAHEIDLVGSCEGPTGLVRAELALAAHVGREHVLREALTEAPFERWDVVLIDTPPSLGLLTVNALSAASFVLTPVVPAYLSILSVRQLEATVTAVQKRINPRLRSFGYLLCAVDGRERVAADAREVLREHVGEALWRQEVRVDSKLKAAPTAGTGRGRGAEDYGRVAAELLRRFKKLPLQ